MVRLGPCILVSAILLSSCGPKTQPAALDFNRLTEDFVYGMLSLSPVSATAAGYHSHNGVPLDELLDDYSQEGLEAQRHFLHEFETRLTQASTGTLSTRQKTDIGIMRNASTLALLELDTIQGFKHNPTIYVELLGNALFTPYTLHYAPEEERFRQIVRRMEKIPALLSQAKANLVDSPEVWNRVAMEENEGNIDLIDKTLREKVPEAQKASYDRAAESAIASLKDFNGFLKNTLAKKPSDWRLGKDKYAKKFAATLVVAESPEQLLAEAEADLQKVRAEMAKLAAPKTIPQALKEVAAQQPTADTFIQKATDDLKEATDFVRTKDLLTLPARGNLSVIETPEFMRGIYAVGGFNPAPPLEPQLGAYYWITPIPKDWPKDRVESKLREYNDYGLQELTIHEAMPGHYVQLEYANDVQPVSRRILRNLYGNGPYVEGWGVYAQQVMSEQGYLNNSKALWLTYYKQMLRVITNTILDIRLQTMGMTDQEALDLMMKEAFQEREEATAKLQRAQLSSCQLPTYYAGWKGWNKTRDDYKKKLGDKFTLKQFHEAALKESALPLPALDQILIE